MEIELDSWKLPDGMSRLPIIYGEVAARTAAIAEGRDWPCKSGCDHCCRSLSSPMSVTAPEWAEMSRALDALDAETKSAILDRVRAGDPRICAFLEASRGLCSIYEHRPAACRSYGFYLSEGEGTWCERVTAHVAAIDDGELVFGHHDALMRALEREGGPRRSIAEWLTIGSESA